MKRAVSVSLGSSKRNKKVIITFDDVPIEVERIGTDGDPKKARQLFAELDGKVDALGVGGVELYLRLGDREYPLRSGIGLIRDVHKTPAVDGRGLKHTLERRVFELAASELGGMPHYRRAFFTLGVDRFGMAQAVSEVADEVIFGDLMFVWGFRRPSKGWTICDGSGGYCCRLWGNCLYRWFIPRAKNKKRLSPNMKSIGKKQS